MGIVNTAADSDGRYYSGIGVRAIRERQTRLVRKLQKKAEIQRQSRKMPKIHLPRVARGVARGA